METFKATIVRSDQNTILALDFGDATHEIILTEDNPKKVKSVFNQLLLRLKNGVFKFELDDTIEDLYYHISKEYLTQLNAELSGVYKELEDYELVSKTTTPDKLEELF